MQDQETICIPGYFTSRTELYMYTADTQYCIPGSDYLESVGVLVQGHFSLYMAAGLRHRVMLSLLILCILGPGLVVAGSGVNCSSVAVQDCGNVCECKLIICGCFSLSYAESGNILPPEIDDSLSSYRLCVEKESLANSTSICSSLPLKSLPGECSSKGTLIYGREEHACRLALQRFLIILGMLIGLSLFLCFCFRKKLAPFCKSMETKQTRSEKSQKTSGKRSFESMHSIDDEKALSSIDYSVYDQIQDLETSPKIGLTVH